ncbi:rhodanese-like domain-containing protein [[Mycobacterium] burgundiense]|uniref:Rhodanese-like domain-containing protein n=1 Tax=[Mycobacterium] burgundiense TaxID=3064286 RepID=A0ABM9LVK8_9MYCO|nr:rhodanese-like domain-containing protein [Mycolicibacterium sp. MU0053]CAJ1505475.1 rhodanese-like domain-containing protein [Mycolicibacterium sp. MU0053]
MLTAAMVSVAVGVFTGCGIGEERPEVVASSTSALAVESHRLVGPDEFAAAITEPDRVTINVHVPYEGDIPGTDLSIPFDQIDEQATALPAARGTPLAIYCLTGPMSAQAAEDLTALGYTDLVELRGGMNAWQDSGRTLVGT